MSNFYSGQNGRLLIDGTAAGKVTNWNFSSSMAPLSTTSLEDTDQTYINGMRSISGSASLYYYDTGGVSNTNSASTLIDKLIKTRTTADDAGKAAQAENVTLRLQIKEGNIVKQIEIDVLLTNATMNMAVGEVLSAQISFQANGAPTELSL